MDETRDLSPVDDDTLERADSTASPGASKPPAGLYLVATPIGNMADITLRALDLLRAADAIACEDSRVTLKLLQRYGIKARLIAYHDHNGAEARPDILRRLGGGQVIALVSDAGTPLISDPGYKLVRAVVEAGHKVTALPGPSSVLAALSLAGLPTDRFLFAGFLPPRSEARRKALAELKTVPATLVFLEGVSRLPEALADMAEMLGGTRGAAVARELTKLFETVRRGTLDELAALYAAEGPPKGEVVVVVGPPAEEAMAEGDLDAALIAAMAHSSLREAAAAVAAATGLPRRQVYARALALKAGDEA
jgi:16S rRNA (cytidine1402-2'-O)-methyltransferase